MSALPEQTWTAETYLAFERASQDKHEFLNGEIYAMAGASLNHIRIVGNTNTSLHIQLRNRPCEVYATDMRVKVSPTGLYTYPDLVIVCGEPLLEDEHQDTLLNPIIIIEVLSPSTETYDRGKKFQHYRRLESLQEYVLIAQDNYHIEHFVRQNDGQWLYSDVTQPEDVLQLPSVECSLLVADVYEKVTFEETAS